MIQFLGNIEAKIDAKSRVFVPAVFRKQLQALGESVLVLRKDIFQDCLVLYPLKVWEDEVSVLRSRLNKWDKKEQERFRQYVVTAERLEMDASGRILIPKRCAEMVGVESDIQFLGVDNTIEIWAKGKLESTMISSEDFGVEIQRLMGGGTNE
ncbi:division/cell wall cluster transcriptional repressor MraZ [Dysgonomonas sp. 520]|uniref:division/cell wall cluster transcriptional repressor MraZ n=1 Tax=Dysgonomonas sp. 520 TaxID=2302931 RepID=UPI0013D62D94|nr:cell division/cell wall cluster transcriptional repressor MraZ [Dysgonomonas sp. 520]NDW10877.1 cell division/cell wall cluster transcriptional repressor MraZ [Dysgonomonas sp. 520]